MRRAAQVRVAVTGTVIVLLAGACSGGGGSDEGAATTTTAAAATTSIPGSPTTGEPEGTTTTTTTVPAADPADVALAEGSLVTAVDLGAGWEAQPAAGGAGGNERIQPACPTLAGELDAAAAEQDPPPARAATTLALGDAGLPVLRQAVVVARDDGLATRTYDLYARDRFTECLTEVFLAEMQEGGVSVVQPPQISDLPIAPAGDAIMARRATVVVTMEGAEVTIFLDHVVLRRGRVVHTLLLGSADLFPVPDGALTSAVEATAS